MEGGGGAGRRNRRGEGRCPLAALRAFADSCTGCICSALGLSFHLSARRALPRPPPLQLAHLRLHPEACAVPSLPETACHLLANFTLADTARLWLPLLLQFLEKCFVWSHGAPTLCLSCFSSFCDRLCLEVVFLKPGLESGQVHSGTGGGRIIGIRASVLCCAGGRRQRAPGKRGNLLSWTLRKYVLLCLAVENYLSTIHCRHKVENR